MNNPIRLLDIVAVLSILLTGAVIVFISNKIIEWSQPLRYTRWNIVDVVVYAIIVSLGATVYFSTKALWKSTGGFKLEAISLSCMAIAMLIAVILAQAIGWHRR